MDLWVRGSRRGLGYRWYLQTRCRWKGAEASDGTSWGNKDSEKGPRMEVWRPLVIRASSKGKEPTKNQL